MRVLWVCNIMLPFIAESLGMEASNKEGWLSGLAGKLWDRHSKNDIELGICFPVEAKKAGLKGKANGVRYFGFYENVKKETEYEVSLDSRMKEILEAFQPDVVHIFGTEFPHALACVKAFGRPERTLIGLQGVCAACAIHYLDGIPEEVRKGKTFRDRLKKDNLQQQQDKFHIRAGREEEALKNVNHVTGRTDMDKSFTREINSGGQYHFMNETLRSNFYHGKWSVHKCERHTILISQGDYPLKGFHYMLEALPLIQEKYPDVQVYVAGNRITGYRSLKDKLKISSYGVYLRRLMRENKLEERIVFMGMVDAGVMRDAMLHSHVFVSPSAMENSPNSVGEAMLLGVPVVSSDAGGVVNLLRDGRDGLLYPAGDVQSLADCVCRIFDDEELSKRLSKSAREHAALTHDPETNYRRLLEIYHEINHQGKQ